MKFYQILFAVCVVFKANVIYAFIKRRSFVIYGTISFSFTNNCRKIHKKCIIPTGLAKDQGYLEKVLPSFLQKSLDNMQKSWAMEDRGQRDPHWDIYWCDLSADINAAQTDQHISSRQARYLRETYLRIKREDF